MFLLDTDVVSELRRPHRIHPRVAGWADSVSPLDLFLSSITILELETGALLLERRDRARGGLIRLWIEDRVLPGFAERILAIDTAVAAVRTPSRPRPEAIPGFVDRGDGARPPADRRDSEPGGFRTDGGKRFEPVGVNSGTVRASLPARGDRRKR